MKRGGRRTRDRRRKSKRPEAPPGWKPSEQQPKVGDAVFTCSHPRKVEVWFQRQWGGVEDLQTGRRNVGNTYALCAECYAELGPEDQPKVSGHFIVKKKDLPLLWEPEALS